MANTSYEGKNKYLRDRGAIIGEGTRLNCGVESFGSEPYLIEVGKNCLFAMKVEFITHDGGVKVLNSLNYFGDSRRMDKIASIKIGNNTYIGMGAYIMPGVTIGDNCIVGAKALVTHDVPNNSIVVGIPARKISDLDDYYKSALSKNQFYPTAGLSQREKRIYFDSLK